MKRPQRRTFAETVADVKANPPSRRKVRRHPGVTRDGQWIDPDGREYRLVDAELSPARARILAGDGASVVYDACGCGGLNCPTPLRWATADQLQTLATVTPTLRPAEGPGGLQEWCSDDERRLVVVVNQVSWGDVGS